MKFKTILIIALIVLTTFIIYLATIDRKVYYLDLNISNYKYEQSTKNYLKDKVKLEKFVTGYIEEDYRTTDLINDIKNNKYITIKNKKQTIKNALIKADLVTLTTGFNDFNYKIETESLKDLYNYADKVLIDIEELLEQVRQYCKEDIIFIGLNNIYGKNYEELFQYINNKIGEICYDNKIYFINPMEFEKDISVNQEIKKQIKQIIDDKILD